MDKKEYDKIKGQYQEDENLLIENLKAGLDERQGYRVRDFEGEREYLLQKQTGVNAAFEAEKVAAAGNAEALKDIDKRRTKFNGEIADANKEITKSEQDYKAAAIQQGVATLEQASELLGKDTVAGKATAIAATTIRTYEAAQKAYASLAGIPVVGPTLAPIAAAAAIAAGLATVKKIVSTKVPSAKGEGQAAGSSGGGVSTPAFSQPNIAAPQIGATANQQGQLAGIVAGALDRNNSEGRPIRAYVVGQDVTTEQQLQRMLKQEKLIMAIMLRQMYTRNFMQRV